MCSCKLNMKYSSYKRIWIQLWLIEYYVRIANGTSLRKPALPPLRGHRRRKLDVNAVLVEEVEQTGLQRVVHLLPCQHWLDRRVPGPPTKPTATYVQMTADKIDRLHNQPGRRLKRKTTNSNLHRLFFLWNICYSLTRLIIYSGVARLWSQGRHRGRVPAGKCSYRRGVCPTPTAFVQFRLLSTLPSLWGLCCCRKTVVVPSPCRSHTTSFTRKW